jgi:predicted DCC family thiol-disulfide oxidoreductase YuxK
MFEVDKKALHEHGVLPCQLGRFLRERGYELFRANRHAWLSPAQCVSDDSVSWFNLFAVHSGA